MHVPGMLFVEDTDVVSRVPTPVHLLMLVPAVAFALGGRIVQATVVLAVAAVYVARDVCYQNATPWQSCFVLTHDEASSVSEILAVLLCTVSTFTLCDAAIDATTPAHRTWLAVRDYVGLALTILPGIMHISGVCTPILTASVCGVCFACVVPWKLACDPHLRARVGAKVWVWVLSGVVLFIDVGLLKCGDARRQWVPAAQHVLGAVVLLAIALSVPPKTQFTEVE